MQSQVTKQLIYESAIRQFKEKGFDNVTIGDICSDVGMTVGAFYYHFKCKEDIIYLWAAERDKQHKAYYINQLMGPNRNDTLALLRGLVLCTLDIYRAWGWELAAVSFSYVIRNPEADREIVEKHREYYAILCNLVKRGLQEGLLRNDMTEEEIVRSIVRFSRNCVIDWCINGGEEDIISINLPFIRAFFDGVRAQPKR